MAIPLTSTLRGLSFAYTLLIEPDRGNRLSVPSVAMVFQIVSLDRERFLRRTGVVSREDMDAINASLADLLGVGSPL